MGPKDASRPTCPLCGERLNLAKLRRLRHAVDKGEECNAHVRAFMDAGVYDVLQSNARFHRSLANKSLTKEVTESWAIVESVRHVLASRGIGEDEPFHVVDLCCGKSLTSALFEILFPKAHVIAVDRLAESMTPHFTGLTSYLRADILHATFEGQCARLVRSSVPPSLSPSLSVSFSISLPRCVSLSLHLSVPPPPPPPPPPSCFFLLCGMVAALK